MVIRLAIVALLSVAAVLVVFGLVNLSRYDMGLGFIGVAVVLVVCARIAQAHWYDGMKP